MARGTAAEHRGKRGNGERRSGGKRGGVSGGNRLQLGWVVPDRHRTTDTAYQLPTHVGLASQRIRLFSACLGEEHVSVTKQQAEPEI